MEHPIDLWVSRSTVETLLEKDFQPKRSVVLAFGFDEETSGLFVSLVSLLKQTLS